MLKEKHPLLTDPAFRLLCVFDRDRDKAKRSVDEIIGEFTTKEEGFNIEKDDYPITMDGLKRIEEMVRQGTVFGYLKVKSNKVSNSQDDAQIAADEV